MHVVVTGGAGFLGSHLCDILLADGHIVYCVDNLYSGQRDNIAHLLDNSSFIFVEHDVIEPLVLPGTPCIDRIYHLACPASPVFYQADPIFTTKTSVHGTLNMLEFAQKHNARILFASTSEVYGNPAVHPQVESYWGNVNPHGIRSCYDEGKRCGESLFFDFHRTYGVDIRVARIFNSYGARMAENDGRVISNFIVQVLSNKDITIFGDGSQTRSFCCGLDTVQGLRALMESNEIGPVNIGNPVENTISEIATIIVSKVPESTSKIIYMPLPSDDPERRLPDITLAKAKLNWTPKIVLSDGLDATIEYFRNRLQLTDRDCPYKRLLARMDAQKSSQ